jgi:phytoene synthase
MHGNYQHCTSLVREADRDRYLATLFAPADKRADLFALYAFDVEVARIGDNAREPMAGEIRLQWWREALSGERDGEAAAHPVASALRATFSHYSFSSAPLLELLDARTFDLFHEPFVSVDALELYAIRTRSPIFALACGILGGGAPPPDLATLDASIAATIGDSLRNFARHAARRQIYLPLDVIGRHSFDLEGVIAGQSSPALLSALSEMRSLARRHLGEAENALNLLPAEMTPAFLPLALIGPMLLDMDASGYEPFRWRPAAPWRRQWRLWRAARNTRRIFAV